MRRKCCGESKTCFPILVIFHQQGRKSSQQSERQCDVEIAVNKFINLNPIVTLGVVSALVNLEPAFQF